MILLLALLQLPVTPLQVRVIAQPSRLVQATDLVYQGAFKLPQGDIGSSSFAYGGSALAYHDQSFFMVGHPYQQQVAEVSIPELSGTATVLQSFTSVGQLQLIGMNPCCDSPIVGGLLAYESKLYESAYLYYDGTAGQVLSHFVSGLDLSLHGDVTGPFQIGRYGLVSGQNTAGFVDGWMAIIPVEWRAALGGPVLAGNCCIPIISRTSIGPAAFVIDPTQLGAAPLSAVPVLYYTSPVVADVTTQMGGAVFPSGTRSLLFFGRIGLGTYCYGEGTTDQSLDGKSVNGGIDVYCYDPAEGSKGPHMYPYTYYVWAYDALDLIKVKQGQLAPWDVRPYAMWRLPLPNPIPEQIIQGVAIDQAANRIFVSQYHGDGSNPLIHVFTVKQ